MKIVELQERGLKLPVGEIKQDGSLEQSFTLRPYKSRIDRQLGDWREANAVQFKGDEGRLLAHMTAKFVSMILESACGKANTLTEDGNSTPEAELAIHQWPMADVFYVYMMARVSSLGHKLEAPCQCGQCGWFGDLTFDLNTLDVKCMESKEDLDNWVELKRPFVGRKGNKITSVRLGPVRWVTFTKPGVLQSKMRELEYHTLIDSIYGINGDESQPYEMTIDELDEMEKLDRARISKVADKYMAGFDFRTTSKCPKCGSAIHNPLDWSFDYFFGSSVPLEM